jgi:hypothetical protein
VGILLFVLFLGFAMPEGGTYRSGCQTQSENQMRQIAIALSLYHGDHHEFPQRLSALVPDYVPTTDIFYFRCRYGAAFVPSGASKDLKLIDIFSPYELRTLGDGGAVVFERVPLWPDGKVGFCLLRPASDYLSGSRVPREEFASRYSKLFQP